MNSIIFIIQVLQNYMTSESVTQIPLHEVIAFLCTLGNYVIY